VRSLVASGKLLPHSKKYLFGWSAWTQKVTFSGPMGTAGLQTATGTTGDRPEIGPVTVAQADYIVNGTPLALSTMMAQAEAAASMPIHLRNEATGKFLDFQADTLYATLQLFTASGWAQGGIPDAPAPRDASGNLDPRFFHMDAAHWPSLCSVPYLLTDDPYYLEEVQALATFDIAIAGYHRYAQQLKGLVYPGETRATAWGLRDVAQAALVSPETSWLLPKSYWLANLADNRTFLRRFQTSPAKVHTVFRAYPRVDWVGGFQSDYLSIVLAWIVGMGFTEWSDGYTWFMGGVLPQVSDRTGWLKGWPDPYYYTPFIADPGAITLVPDTSLDGNTYATWADTFAGMWLIKVVQMIRHSLRILRRGTVFLSNRRNQRRCTSCNDRALCIWHRRRASRALLHRRFGSTLK
jgi:hypothetical protein